MIRRRVVVSGQVQGVGFRYHTRKQAIRLGVSGSVSNAADGTVIADVEGDDDAVQRMIEWLRTGPEWAEVDAIDVEKLEPVGGSGFDVAL